MDKEFYQLIAVTISHSLEAALAGPPKELEGLLNEDLVTGIKSGSVTFAEMIASVMVRQYGLRREDVLRDFGFTDELIANGSLATSSFAMENITNMVMKDFEKRLNSH